MLTLDADLQDDPAEVGRFLDALAGGLDVVSGWKKARHDPWHKVGPSRLFNWVVSRSTGCRLHDHNCGFKAYRSDVLREVGLYGEMHRFIPVLAHARGFKVGEIVVNHRARKFGRSKYGVGRLVKGFLDLLTVRFLTRFRASPLHILGSLGLVMLLVGGLGMAYLAVLWFRERIGERPLLIYSAALLGVGVQLLSLGVLAELVTAYNLRPRDTYSVAERVRAKDVEPRDVVRMTRDSRSMPDVRPPGVTWRCSSSARPWPRPSAWRSGRPRSSRPTTSRDGARSGASWSTAPTRSTTARGNRRRRTRSSTPTRSWRPTPLRPRPRSGRPARRAGRASGRPRGSRAWSIGSRPRSWKADPALGDEPPTWHFYSSKPPLLPTMIAGVLYPFRKASGIPLDKGGSSPTASRGNVQKANPTNSSPTSRTIVPKDKIKWPVYVFYFKPIVVLLNILPMLVFLVLYARLLDRLATNDWAWMASLFAGAWGTLLFAFDQTLNNHTVAAYSAFFALYATIKIFDDEAPSRRSFMAAGFWASFCACNELPAALFGLLLFACVFVRSPGRCSASSRRRRRSPSRRSSPPSSRRWASSRRLMKISARAPMNIRAACGRPLWSSTT